LARGAREGGIYRLLVDLVALVHYGGRPKEPPSFEEVLARWDAMR